MENPAIWVLKIPPGILSSRKPAFVDMQSIPHVGEFLVSGKHGACEVLKVVHTRKAAEQALVIELGPGDNE